MAGGVLAGLIRPQAVTATMDIWQRYLFFVTYLVQAALAAVSMLVLVGIRIPAPACVSRVTGRPLKQIASQPRFIMAVICGVVSCMMMNLVMTSAPLAMKLFGLSLASANLGIQWYMVAMYGPSFVTGRLITRFGAPVVVATGLILIACAAANGLAGIDVDHF